jgi:glycosyltransferase involved in cell wall biosynthesis
VDPLDELLLVAGRIDPQKNQALALDILAALQASRPRLRLALMGPVTSPAYLESLRQSALRLGVADRVTFFEAAQGSSDLADAYAAADVVLVPSAHEPFGIVVLEAWASTRPVIASRVGGLIDLISDGRDGRLIDPTDIESWIHAVVDLLDGRPAAWSMSCAGRAKALKSYTWDAVAGKLLTLYGEVSRKGLAKTPRAVANRSVEPSRLFL